MTSGRDADGGVRRLCAPSRGAGGIDDWIELRRSRCLSHIHVQMLCGLGMNPRTFGTLDNHTQELWKAPLGGSIEDSYRKRFRKDRTPLSRWRNSCAGATSGGANTGSGSDRPRPRVTSRLWTRGSKERPTMSEYQYYEFRTVDRPLTAKQLAEVRACSSRAAITPTSFVNVYNYGDFRGDPVRWMREYFDVHVYDSNWGTRRVMFRLPRRLVEASDLERYAYGSGPIELVEAGDHVILELRVADEGGGAWGDEADDRAVLPALLPLRGDIIRGDHRALYIAWLASLWGGVDYEDDEEDGENRGIPPIPPGLKGLTPALEALADFLGVDGDLLAAAAEVSPPMPDAGAHSERIRQWAGALSECEKTEALVRLINAEGEAAALELRAKALSAGPKAPGADDWPTRTVEELVARSREIRLVRERREAQRKARKRAEQERKAERERQKRLDALESKEDGAWQRARALAEEGRAQPYEEAVALIRDLRDLAERQGTGEAFERRVAEFRSLFEQRAALIRRLNDAGMGE